MKIGFDNDKYVKLQSEKINERIKSFGGKLYLEFGGKLFDDRHASRVLPGFESDTKVKMLCELKDKVEIVVAINAHDIDTKVRSDFGITYNQDLMRLIDAFRSVNLYVGSVVISQFNDQKPAVRFKQELERQGIKVYLHYIIENYPHNVEHVVSEEGYGKNEFIETSRELVVVTAPGPGSGKLATCLSQLYHEHKRGVNAGYAKFETFPIWNLPLKHPVNLSYEAATADLSDINMIDPFHLEKYGETTINYNRDVEAFPIVKMLLGKISNDVIYHSPTDMGVNMAGYCIIDDDACCNACKDEIVRRYYDTIINVDKNLFNETALEKCESIMNQLGIDKNYRDVVSAANEKSTLTNTPCVAIKLNDGKIITGKTSSLLGASSATILNALKYLSGIDDLKTLISPRVIEPIQKLKTQTLGNSNPRLHIDEILITLSIDAVTNEYAAKALDSIKLLKNCEAHSTVYLSEVDRNLFSLLGIRLTQNPIYQSKRLYHKK